MPSYPKNYPFYSWMPKPLGIIILLFFFLPILTVGGVYSVNSTEMMSGLGIISEHIQFANFVTSIGMAAFAPFLYQLVCVRREKMMCIVGFAFMYIFSYICAKTDSVFLLALCSLLTGFLRMVLMMVNLFTLIWYAGGMEATRNITPGLEPKDTAGWNKLDIERCVSQPAVYLFFMILGQSGDKVNTTPYFVAKLWDKSGVNITGSSVGHDMMLTIDSMPSMSYNLNSYYALLPDSENEGLVQFSIPELEPGMHTAEFKVWDILNNSTTYTFTFEVAEGLKPNLIELYATPNPARDQVEFFLHHKRPESNLKVTVMVYDMTGKFLWSTEKSGSSELFKAYIVTWNLTDNGGRRLRPGVYLYRAAISTNNSKEATKANKLIILAQ